MFQNIFGHRGGLQFVLVEGEISNDLRLGWLDVEQQDGLGRSRRDDIAEKTILNNNCIKDNTHTS